MGDYMDFEKRFRNAIWVVRDVLRKFYDLRIPDNAKDEVFRLLEKAMRRGLAWGRSIEMVASCLLYYVVKRDNLPLTAYEIAGKMEFGKHEMLRTYFKLRKELNLGKQKFDSSSLIERYAYKLDLNPKKTAEAYKKLEKVKGLYVDPRIKVGYALYEASGKTQDEVAEVLAISTSSICRLISKVREPKGEAFTTKVDKAVGFKSFRSGSPLSVQVS